MSCQLKLTMYKYKNKEKNHTFATPKSINIIHQIIFYEVI